MNILSSINFDTIISDPILLISGACFLLGPLIFLIAFVQWIRSWKKEEDDFVIPPDESAEEPPFESVESLGTPVGPATGESSAEPPLPTLKKRPQSMIPEQPVAPALPPESEISVKAEPAPAPGPRAPAKVVEPAHDRTMIMAPGTSEMQAQLEIAITQLKTLNKKVYELESQIVTLSQRGTSGESNDVAQNLAKLANYVTSLAKEIAVLKKPSPAEPPAAPAAPPAPPTAPVAAAPQAKPPIMPL